MDKETRELLQEKTFEDGLFFIFLAEAKKGNEYSHVLYSLLYNGMSDNGKAKFDVFLSSHWDESYWKHRDHTDHFTEFAHEFIPAARDLLSYSPYRAVKGLRWLMSEDQACDGVFTFDACDTRPVQDLMVTILKTQYRIGDPNMEPIFRWIFKEYISRKDFDTAGDLVEAFFAKAKSMKAHEMRQHEIDAIRKYGTLLMGIYKMQTQSSDIAELVHKTLKNKKYRTHPLYNVCHHVATKWEMEIPEPVQM